MFSPKTNANFSPSEENVITLCVFHKTKSPTGSCVVVIKNSQETGERYNCILFRYCQSWKFLLTQTTFHLSWFHLYSYLTLQYTLHLETSLIYSGFDPRAAARKKQLSFAMWIDVTTVAKASGDTLHSVLENLQCASLKFNGDRCSRLEIYITVEFPVKRTL